MAIYAQDGIAQEAIEEKHEVLTSSQKDNQNYLQMPCFRPFGDRHFLFGTYLVFTACFTL